MGSAEQRRAPWRRLLSRALGCALALPGCFSPNLEQAECLSCPDGVCPGSMVCREMHCVHPGSATQCSAHTGGAGEGGTGPTTPGIGGGAAEDTPNGVGGTPGEAGAVGAGSAAAGGTNCVVDCGGAGEGSRGPTLAVTAVPEYVCTGDDVHVELSVTGGVPPYAWELTGDAPGLELETQEATATLQGVFAASGDYSVTATVTDGDGQHARRRVELTVRSTPSVRTRTEDIGSVCENQRFSVKLGAEGGVPSDYEWSMDELPAKTGLVLSGDRLEGRFAGAGLAAQEIPFKVSVESAGCRSAPVTLTLDVNALAATACPRVQPRDYWPALPDPCRGLDYSVVLTAKEGVAPYVWREVSLPAGLAFDSTTATVSGVVKAAVTGTVEVEDATGRIVEGDFTLTPRDSCWLAYLAGPQGDTRLELFDPLLQRREPLPRAGPATPVTDFEFSPNGRWLAYRTGTDPTRGALRLLDMTTLAETSLDFDSATFYVWSDDSASLLVAFDTDEGRFLGGVVPASTPGTPSYVAFTPGAANVDSPPVAFGSSAVGFLSADGPIQRLVTAQRTSQGFAAGTVHIDSFFDYGDRLKPAPGGLFGIPASDFDITYWPADGSYASPHNAVLVAPSGRYVARAQDGALAMFLPTEDSSDPYTLPHASSEGCEHVLAWAKQRERIACSRVAEALEPGPRVTFFDLDRDTDTLSSATLLRGAYDYPEIAPSNRHRLLSPSGSRFAFTTSTNLYVANVAASDAAVSFGHAFVQDQGVDAELGFSPDEQSVAAHRGTILSLFPLAGDTHQEAVVDQSLPPAAACDERARAEPGTSCGDARAHPAFAWSAASTFIAYSTSAGRLRVYDLSEATPADVVDDCAGSCRAGATFAFQPQ
jgi:hypothetical protein